MRILLAAYGGATNDPAADLRWWSADDIRAGDPGV
jgi:hypothetical protein